MDSRLQFTQYTRTTEPYFSQNYNPDLIQPKEMNPQDLIDKRIVKTLLIDNRDRDRSFDAGRGANTSNTAPYSFVVDIQDCGVPRYENVISVELKALTFPKIEGESYVVIDINEAAGKLDSTDNNGSNQTFGIAYFDGYETSDGLTGMKTGDVKPIKGSDFLRKIAVFDPIKTISKLHVNFKTYGGNIVTKAMVANVENVSMLLEFQCVNRNIN